MFPINVGMAGETFFTHLICQTKLTCVRLRYDTFFDRFMCFSAFFSGASLVTHLGFLLYIRYFLTGSAGYNDMRILIKSCACCLLMSG